MYCLSCAFASGGQGINHRFYQGYHPEDFIGKVANICSAGSNTNLEFVALKRFFVGQLCFEYGKDL